MRARTALLALVFGVVATSGCNLSSHHAFQWLNPNASKTLDNLAADPRSPAKATAAAGRSPVQRALDSFASFPFDVELTDITGQTIQLQDYRGKVVVVDLWGTWCGPCRRVIPHLVEWQRNHPEDVQILGLCNERTSDLPVATENLKRAMHELGINYPCALIDDSTTRKVPNFSGYPTMLFIDRSGTVRMATVGVKPEAYWDSLLEELLAS